MRALVLTALLAAAPAAAETPLSAAEFESIVTGRTLSYASSGGEYGAEEYFDGRRVRWSYLDGDCAEGRWYEAGEQNLLRLRHHPRGPVLDLLPARRPPFGEVRERPRRDRALRDQPPRRPAHVPRTRGGRLTSPCSFISLQIRNSDVSPAAPAPDRRGTRSPAPRSSAPHLPPSPRPRPRREPPHSPAPASPDS